MFRCLIRDIKVILISERDFKKALSLFLVSVMRFLNKLDQKITHYTYTPNPKAYEDLTPHDVIKGEDKDYFEAIDWSLRNQNITNIAHYLFLIL